MSKPTEKKVEWKKSFEPKEAKKEKKKKQQ